MQSSVKSLPKHKSLHCIVRSSYISRFYPSTAAITLPLNYYAKRRWHIKLCPLLVNLITMSFRCTSLLHFKMLSIDSRNNSIPFLVRIWKQVTPWPHAKCKCRRVRKVKYSYVGGNRSCWLIKSNTIVLVCRQQLMMIDLHHLQNER